MVLSLLGSLSYLSETLFALWFTLLIAYQSVTLDVVVVPKKGATVYGQAELDLSFDATIGHIEIDPDHLRQLTFDNEDVSVVGDDGTVVRGHFSWQTIHVETDCEVREFALEELKRLSVVRLAEPVAGEVTSGRHANGLSYHLRAPQGYSADAQYDALVLLHGSNMNALSYINTVVERWPEIAGKYLLIGVNGENRSQGSTPESPRFNYSYVNFVGKGSKYKGYPGTDRESPALLKELVQDLRATLPLRRVFVGGHSQGAFLTYTTVMHFPELFDGAFPIAGGIIIQAEPAGFNEEAIRKAQRETPIAIVHGTTDSTVQFRMSKSALRSYRDEDFPMVKLFTHDTAGHRFMFLPVDRAIRWLEEMSSSEPEVLLETARQRFEEEAYREACALVQRSMQLSEAAEAEGLIKQLNEKAQLQMDKLKPLMEANADGAWVDDFQQFREQFGLLEQADEILKIYAKLREEHQPKADELYKASKEDYQAGRRDEAYAKYQEVVDNYYASSWYSKMQEWIANRKK